MGIDVSDNYIMVWISAHVDTAFFTQNKAMNNHLKFGKCFEGHCIYFRSSYIMINESPVHNSTP